MEAEIENDPVVFQDSFCPLCSSKRNVFTCAKCISLGLFYRSRKANSERYTEFENQTFWPLKLESV